MVRGGARVRGAGDPELPLEQDQARTATRLAVQEMKRARTQIAELRAELKKMDSELVADASRAHKADQAQVELEKLARDLKSQPEERRDPESRPGHAHGQGAPGELRFRPLRLLRSGRRLWLYLVRGTGTRRT